jgi:FkbM family methyltransferase
MMRRTPWSDWDVVLSVLAAASRVRDRLWVLRYFAGRRLPAPLAALISPRQARLHLRGLAGPMVVSPASGGLATYYEIGTRRIYAPLAGFAPEPGDVVIDVGANIGVFSLWAARLIGSEGRLLAIEPTPAAFGNLSQALASTGQAHRAVACACSATAGTLTLHYPPGRLSVASVEPRTDRTLHVDVPSRPLADVAREAGISRVDFLKIDVEGLELEVLQGAAELLSSVERLAMEVDAAKLAAVESLLADHGLERVATVTGMWSLPTAMIVCFARPVS